MIREASEGAPPASDDRGPTGMQRVGKGLSRLSLGVASLFGALDVLDGGERSEARRRAELEELGFVEIEGAQGSESNAAPPRSPSPFARRLGGFRRNKPAKQGGFVGMCRSIIDRALGAENPSNMMAPREQVDDLEADAQPLTGSAVAELARARPEISAPLPAAAASPQTKRRKESGADNNRSEGTKEPFQRLRRAFSTKDKENSPLLKPGLGLQPTVVDGYGAVVQGGGWPTGKLAASGSKKKRKEERADTFWRPRGEAAPESMTSSSDSQEAERIRNLGRRWASPPPEGQVRESKVLRERLDLNAESLRQTLPLPPLNDSAAVAVPRPGGASVRTTSEHSARVPQARLTMADVPMSCQSITDVPAGSSAAGHGQDDADSSDDGNYLEPGSRDDERRDSAATARPMSHSKTSESIVTSDARDGLVIRAPSASPSLSRAHQLVSDTSLSSSPGKAKRSKPSSWRRFGRSNNGDADTGASSSDENQLPTPRRRSFSLTRPASRGADSAPMRPGGAQIIARPADAGIAVFSGAR
ncbi:hypothetical protein FA09DRAFT_257501 [Tilletiopsis washingtonensis]|uniref:Uncharacterized protein n=1 Tax=Tilletiopsis washingtonensis TaxID=58919 RepID=A0A316ZAN1_9BASI|nr:hypothetical protein FA09DRAFT_257501 [Tilletiopsis washingtonensis]PWN98877.1 hypothetical protein FA09DRAFT_257501 [Tilletiopsis washingtonensis]